MDLVKGYNSEMESDSDIEEVPLPPKHVEVIDIDNSDSDIEVERRLIPISNTNQPVSIFIKSEPGLTEQDSALKTSGYPTKKPEPAINKLDLASNDAELATKETKSVLIEWNTALTTTGQTTKQSEPVTVERDTTATKTGHTTNQPGHTIERDTTLTKARHTSKQPESVLERDAALTKTGHTTDKPEPVSTERDSVLNKTGHTTKQPEPVISEQGSILTKTGQITNQPTTFNQTGQTTDQSTALTKTGQTTRQPEPAVTEQDTLLTKTGQASNHPTTLTKPTHTIPQPEPTVIEKNTTLTNARRISKELEPEIVELLESAPKKPADVTEKPEPMIIDQESTPSKTGNAIQEPEPDIIDLESTPTKASDSATEPEPAVVDLEATPSKPGNGIKESESVFMKQGHVTKEPESVFMELGHVAKEPESVFMKQGHVTKEPDPVLTTPSQPVKEPQPVLSSKPVPEDNGKESDAMDVTSSPVKSHDERSAVTGNDNFVCRIPRHMIEIKNAHKDLVSSLDWCTVSNPSVFLSSSCDGFIKVWDVIKMDLKHSLRVLTQVTAAKWSLDGAIIFTGGSNKKLAVYEAQTITKFIEYDVYCKVYSMAIHPYIHDVVLVGLKNAMLGYDLRVDSLLPIRMFPCKCEEVLDIAFLDDNVFVSSGNIGFNDSNRNRITAWEFGSSKALSTDIFCDHCVCPSLKLHPSDSTFIAQTTSNYITTFSSVYPFTMKNKKFAGHNVNSQLIECDISPDGKYVATGDANGAVHFYSYAGGNQVYTSSPQSAGINRIKWNPHLTTTMITSSVNGNIQIWN